MSTMINTIMQQVSEQVKRVMKATHSVRPLHQFNYVLTTGCELSYMYVAMGSHRHSGEVREAACRDRNS